MTALDLDAVLTVLHRIAALSAADPEAARCVLHELAECDQRRDDKDERLLYGQEALDDNVHDAETEALNYFGYNRHKLAAVGDAA